MNTLIRITKREKDILIKNGCKPYDPLQGFRDICITYGHHKGYYLRESKKNMEMLKNIRGEN